MRALWLIPPLLAAAPALAQEQQARAPAEPAATGASVFDMVAADRETAWRINRTTGEVMICRVDTASSLDTVRARCTPAAFETAAQQSQVPGAAAPGGSARP